MLTKDMYTEEETVAPPSRQNKYKTYFGSHKLLR